jgi:hypothetical protein
MLHRVTATLQGHPWDLWGLSQLFDGSDSSKTLVVATKPNGRPTFDANNPDQRTRFRIQGYDVAGQLTCDELVLDDTTGDLRLTHLSYPKENGAGAMTAGDWTPNRDSTFLSASAHRDLATQALKLAGANPAVNFVLDAMTLPATWSSLYLVYDAISTNVGGKPALKKLGWLTDDQIKDLTNSANSSRNIREGARHGNRVDSTRPLIALDSAHILTCQLVVQWLDWLVAQGR